MQWASTDSGLVLLTLTTGLALNTLAAHLELDPSTDPSASWPSNSCVSVDILPTGSVDTGNCVDRHCLKVHFERDGKRGLDKSWLNLQMSQKASSLAWLGN